MREGGRGGCVASTYLLSLPVLACSATKGPAKGLHAMMLLRMIMMTMMPLLLADALLLGLWMWWPSKAKLSGSFQKG